MPERTAAALEALEQAWAEKAPGAAGWYDRAERALPSGLSHDLRNRAVTPPYFVSADGAWKTDVDGNRYLDLWMGHGSLLLGHGAPEVLAAIAEQAPRGTHLGGSHPYEVELAEAFLRLVPGMDRVRFVMSGTEATMLAIRLARAATGRPGILKFQDHFHGWHEVGSVGRAAPYDVPLGGGLPDGLREDVYVIPPNDPELIHHLFDTYGGIAGVILEPTGAHGGQLPFAPGFLEELRTLTRRHGVLLLLDEVITGFRLAPGGAQERLGVEADLASYAKVLFGGLPGGAVAGNAEVMSYLSFSEDPHHNRYRKVPHQGTHNANPIGARVGKVTLEAVETRAPIEAAEAAAAAIKDGANALFRDRGLPWRFHGIGSILHLATGLDAEEACRAEREGWHTVLDRLAAPPPHARRLLDAALLIEGVDFPPGAQAWLSQRHGPEETAFFLRALERALDRLASLGVLA